MRKEAFCREIRWTGWALGVALTPWPSPISPPHPCQQFRFTEGIYALYTYTASPPTSQAVQRLLSTPVAGGEFNILRHMTVRT